MGFFKQPETGRITRRLWYVVLAKYKNLTAEMIVELVTFWLRSMHTTVCSCRCRTITGLPRSRPYAFYKGRENAQSEPQSLSSMYIRSDLVCRKTSLPSGSFHLPPSFRDGDVASRGLHVALPIAAVVTGHLLDLHKHLIYKSPFMVMDWTC